MTGSLHDDLSTHVIGCYDFLCELRARRENLEVINNCGQAVSSRSLNAEARIRASTSPCEM